jgi:hypothetical protein
MIERRDKTKRECFLAEPADFKTQSHLRFYSSPLDVFIPAKKFNSIEKAVSRLAELDATPPHPG